jgi:hypothetical protein
MTIARIRDVRRMQEGAHPWAQSFPMQRLKSVSPPFTAIWEIRFRSVFSASTSTGVSDSLARGQRTHPRTCDDLLVAAVCARLFVGELSAVIIMSSRPRRSTVADAPTRCTRSCPCHAFGDCSLGATFPVQQDHEPDHVRALLLPERFLGPDKEVGRGVATP